MASKALSRWQEFRRSPRYEDRKSALAGGLKAKIMTMFRFILIVGISYVILSPVIGIVARSFFSDADAFNPIVFAIPMAPTLERYQRAMTHLNYWRTTANTLVYTLALTALQVVICSMVGYGFARFQFLLGQLSRQTKHTCCK